LQIFHKEKATVLLEYYRGIKTRLRKDDSNEQLEIHSWETGFLKRTEYRIVLRYPFIHWLFYFSFSVFSIISLAKKNKHNTTPIKFSTNPKL